jgi:hypothetical protein
MELIRQLPRAGRQVLGLGSERKKLGRVIEAGPRYYADVVIWAME